MISLSVKVLFRKNPNTLSKDFLIVPLKTLIYETRINYERILSKLILYYKSQDYARPL